jgi:hypothetical protein
MLKVRERLTAPLVVQGYRSSLFGQKHRFNIAETGIACTKTLQWRTSVLYPLQADAATSAAPFVQCLPRDARDNFGHPVLCIHLARLAGASEASKQEILIAYEEMRMRLSTSQGAILQCVMMIDFKQASMRSMVQ